MLESHYNYNNRIGAFNNKNKREQVIKIFNSLIFFILFVSQMK